MISEQKYAKSATVSSKSTPASRGTIEPKRATIGPPPSPSLPLENTVRINETSRKSNVVARAPSRGLSFVDISTVTFDPNSGAKKDDFVLETEEKRKAKVRLIYSRARSEIRKSKESQETQETNNSEKVERSLSLIFKGISQTVLKATRSVMKASEAVDLMAEDLHEEKPSEDDLANPEDVWSTLFSDIKDVGEESRRRWKAGADIVSLVRDYAKNHKKQANNAFVTSKFYRKAHALIGIGRVKGDFIAEDHQDESDDSIDGDAEGSSPRSFRRATPSSGASAGVGFTAALRSIAKIKQARSNITSKHVQDEKRRLYERLYGAKWREILEGLYGENWQEIVFPPTHGKVSPCNMGLSGSGRTSPRIEENQPLRALTAKKEHMERRQRAMRMAAREQQDVQDAREQQDAQLTFPCHSPDSWESAAHSPGSWESAARVERHAISSKKNINNYIINPIIAQSTSQRSPRSKKVTERHLGIGEFTAPSLLAPEALRPDDHQFLRPLSPDEDHLASPVHEEGFPEEIICEAIAVLSGDDIAKMFSELEATADVKCPDNGLDLLETLFMGPPRPALYPLQWTICQWVLQDLHDRMIEHIRSTKGHLSVDPTGRAAVEVKLAELFRQRLFKVQTLLRLHQERAPVDMLKTMVKNEHDRISSIKDTQARAALLVKEKPTDKPGKMHCFFPYAAQRNKTLKLKKMPAPIWQKAQALRTHSFCPI